ncbi:unnamed protein product [Darwinula stevensoni]|uniref:Uncharacterized protein n=1 Tax=Darwinula stevensoni TaxID=69355 RepID=A0A7R9ADI7_9CRUS|nr:unnamed protein product [Darwinula stevensoni]CAG0901347.1 unnamed protein product [Darwinula stevensoni]
MGFALTNDTGTYTNWDSNQPDKTSGSICMGTDLSAAPPRWTSLPSFLFDPIGAGRADETGAQATGSGLALGSATAFAFGTALGSPSTKMASNNTRNTNLKPCSSHQ